VINIICGVGSGDMYPLTDAERWFFSFMIMFGDCMFSVALGLITNATLYASSSDETQQFKEKIYEIKLLM
jgi:hypothetical protein